MKGWAPFAAAAALGLVKGLTSRERLPFSAEQDVYGPAKEEFAYRGLPLWAKPNLPFGSTAAVFAADHLADDLRRHSREGTTMTPGEVVSRLGDVFLGGLAYETAFKRGGILGAIGAHMAHNVFVSLGSKARNRK